MRLGILGCGVVAEKYASALKGRLAITEAWDVDTARLKAFCDKTGVRPCISQAALLKSTQSDGILILTYPSTHESLVRETLLAGKHVFCEKPLAFGAEQADGLFDLAVKQQRILRSAPGVGIGAAQRKIQSLIEAGTIGSIRVVYAEANHWRLEKRHPRPLPIMDTGVLWDQGPYLLTLLTDWLGNLTVQAAWGNVLIPHRADQNGNPVHLRTPDFISAMLQNDQGVTCRMTLNFIAKGSRQGSNIELIGDTGSIWMEHFQDFSSPIQVTQSSQQTEVAVDDIDGYCYGRPVELFAKQISEGSHCPRHRAQVTHVIGLLETIDRTLSVDGVIPDDENAA